MNRSPLTITRSLPCLIGALLATHTARAQTVDASILGSVKDSTGAGLAGVSVAAKNIATGVQWTVSTTSTGRFAFLQLPLGGPYTVTARRLGYAAASKSGYELSLGSRVLIDIVLRRATAELGPVVVVTGAASERRAPSLGANYRVGPEQLATVPAVNRNFTDLAALAPTTGVQSSLLGQRWT